MISLSTFESIIRDYGYWALLIGTFFEGETILIIAGLSAHLGLLQLPYVMLIAFIGSFAGDQLYYFIGYFKGRELLGKHLKWQRRVTRVNKYIERYHNLVMLGFRFVYGMRIATPFVMGTSKNIKTTRFFILNAIGAIIWSVSVSAGGYFFGYALEGFIKDVKHYEKLAIIIILLIGIVLWIIHLYRAKKTPG
ncbi:MAG TPA: DedA family protein [Candidatus Methanoperedens sp.]